MTIDQRWFNPLPKQAAFIRDESKEAVYAGGFGAGKTLAGGFKALRCSLNYPGTVGLVGRETSQALRDTTKKVLVDGDDKPPVIPPELVAYRNDTENRVVLVNGSEILFRSFQDFNVGKVRSLNLGWVYVDEVTETSEAIWGEYVGRLRHPAGPRIAWGTTNPNGHDWVWGRFHPDAGHKSGPLFVSRTEENTHLAADYIAHLRRMPAEWQKRFLDCSFDVAAGQIWPEWDRHIHVVPAFDLPYRWTRVEGLDHGRRNPTAYLQLAADEEGNLIVFDGYYEPGLISQHAAAITMLRGGRRWGPIVADPSCFNRGFDGRMVADEYQERGIYLTPGSNSVEAGLLRVAEWLTRREDEPFPDWHPYAGTLGPDGLGAPRLFVMDAPGTMPLRTEIPQYRWRDLSPTLELRQDQPEEPRKKDDHACDALRYLIMSRPRPTRVPTPDEQPHGREPAHAAGVRTKIF